MPVILPIVLLSVLTVVFRVTDADLWISRLAYQSPESPWPWAHAWICDFIYDYGTLPGLIVGIAGLVVGLAGVFWSRLQPYSRAGFFLAAVLALGPGLLVNGIFKPHWGRPRPHQTVAFGGEHTHVSVWALGTMGGMSFPSGHASMGFYLLVPAFLLYRRRQLAGSLVLLGLAVGLALGVTRILQGSHFFSDVLWSAGFVYLSGLAMAALFGLLRREQAVTGRDAVRVVAAPDPSLMSEGIPPGTVVVEKQTGRRNAA